MTFCFFCVNVVAFVVPAAVFVGDTVFVLVQQQQELLLILFF